MTRTSTAKEVPSHSIHPTHPAQPLFSLEDVKRIFGMKSLSTAHYWRLTGKIREAERTHARGPWRVPRREVIRLLAEEEGGPEIPGLWTRPPVVLVVDDDAGVRDFLAKLFREHQVPVDLVLAADVKAGLRLAKERRPKVVVLDYWFGGKVGRELALPAIAALRKHGDPKVIGISVDASVGPKMLEAGAADFLAKPARPKAFVDVIMKYVRGQARKERDRRRAMRGLIKDGCDAGGKQNACADGISVATS